MEFVVIYLLLCAAVAALANAWNKHPFAWFALSLIISPLIAGIILVLVPRKTEFAADSSYKGVPYFRRGMGSVVAMIDGQRMSFRSMHEFRMLIDARTQGASGAS